MTGLWWASFLRVFVPGVSLNHGEDFFVLIWSDGEKAISYFDLINEAFEVLVDVVFSNRKLVLNEVSGSNYLRLKSGSVSSFEGVEFVGKDRKEHGFDVIPIFLEAEILNGLAHRQAQPCFSNEVFHRARLII